MAPSAMAAPITNGTIPSKIPHPAKEGSYASRHNLHPHFIGGNNVGAAAPSKVKDFVANNDGHTVITSVRRSLEARLRFLWLSISAERTEAPES